MHFIKSPNVRKYFANFSLRVQRISDFLSLLLLYEFYFHTILQNPCIVLYNSYVYLYWKSCWNFICIVCLVDMDKCIVCLVDLHIICSLFCWNLDIWILCLVELFSVIRFFVFAFNYWKNIESMKALTDFAWGYFIIYLLMIILIL